MWFVYLRLREREANSFYNAGTGERACHDQPLRPRERALSSLSLVYSITSVEMEGWER